MAEAERSPGSGQREGAATPILDAHCHAWRRWPYPPLVPDEDSRGSIEQLLYEMDDHGVQQAAVVCAAIDNNPDNVAYVAFARDRHPGRLHVVADLDCLWSEHYHRPGSADRLRALDDAYHLAGFTHYVRRDNDGWLNTAEADAVFAVAEERCLFVSLAAGPAWQADLRELARRHPSVPVLVHHLGGLRTAAALGGGAAGTAAQEEAIAEVLRSAAVPSIHIKVSGFHYASAAGWDHPWREAAELFRRLFDAFGPGRMCWGSDFPASRRFCTYGQSLEAVRTHCGFLGEEDRAALLGGTLAALLDRRPRPSSLSAHY